MRSFVGFVLCVWYIFRRRIARRGEKARMAKLRDRCSWFGETRPTHPHKIGPICAALRAECSTRGGRARARATGQGTDVRGGARPGRKSRRPGARTARFRARQNNVCAFQMHGRAACRRHVTVHMR